jgi:hypothetical protein
LALSSSLATVISFVELLSNHSTARIRSYDLARTSGLFNDIECFLILGLDIPHPGEELERYYKKL